MRNPQRKRRVMSDELKRSAGNSYATWSDLGILLADARAVISYDEPDANALVVKMMDEYHEARANGKPEIKLCCMFGVHRGSDVVAKQLTDEIDRREAILDTVN